MTEVSQVYKCSVCGNIVEVLHAGVGRLVCCGKPMELLKEKVEEAGMEKHVPVIEEVEGGVKVRVGSIPHPMEEKHYVEWIELTFNDYVYKRFLKPGEKPEAKFKVEAKKMSARGYCNIHGLWKAAKR